MTPKTLSYYEGDICARTAFIEPFCTDWDAVSLSSLSTLKDYLLNHYRDFKEIIMNLIHDGVFSHRLLKNIYFSLKKYSRWFFDWQAVIEKQFESDDENVRRKANVATDLVSVIEILWTPIFKDFEFLCNAHLNGEYLTASERTAIHKMTKEEELRRTETKKLLSSIDANSENDRMRKFDIMYDVLSGLGGKDAAKYLEAAYRLGWLVDKPAHNLLQKYWGVTGNAPAISNAFSVKKKSVGDEKIISAAMHELEYKLKG